MKKRVRVGKYKTVFKGTIFDIQQAKAVFSNGKVKTFEKAIRLPTVILLAIDDKNRLLLAREYRINHKKYMLRLPAGRVDRGERPIDAAQRELQEETGFKAKKIKLFNHSLKGQSMEWEKYTYLATSLTRDRLHVDEDEDITIIPTSITKAFNMVLDGTIKDESMAYVIMKLYAQQKRK